MSIDISTLLTQENVIFVAILSIIGLVAFVILFIIVRFIVKLIVGLFKKIFHKNPHRTGQGSDISVAVNELEESKEERAKVGQKKVATATTAGPKLDYTNYPKDKKETEPEKSGKEKFDEKNQKDIAAGLDKLRGDNSSEAEEGGVMAKIGLGSKMKISTATTSGPRLNLSGNHEDSKEAKSTAKNDKQNYDKKEQKDIAVGLDKLKGGDASAQSSEGGDSAIRKITLGSTIRIPVAKRFSENSPKNQATAATVRAINARPDAKIDQLVKKEQLGIKESSTAAPNVLGAKESPAVEQLVAIGADKREKNIFTKKEIKGPTNNASKDESLMFGKGEEVSRVQLRQKLRSSKIFNAERQVGLNLSPVERSKLEKQVFSQSMGGNISKTDLKWGIRKLNQKYLSEKNLSAKAKLRKEIKFFKKIGGVKG